jgi:hypothetical protein
MSWGSSVSILSGYRLDDRAIMVRSPAEAKDFSSSLCVQTGSEAHPDSCRMGTGGVLSPGENPTHEGITFSKMLAKFHGQGSLENCSNWVYILYFVFYDAQSQDTWQMCTTKVMQLELWETWSCTLGETLPCKCVNIPRLANVTAWNAIQSLPPLSLHHIVPLLIVPVQTNGDHKPQLCD